MDRHPGGNVEEAVVEPPEKSGLETYFKNHQHRDGIESFRSEWNRLARQSTQKSGGLMTELPGAPAFKSQGYAEE